MHLRLPMLLVASSLIATSNNAQDSKQLSLGGPPTVEELVAKNVEAKGGADALRALKSVRLKGKLGGRPIEPMPIQHLLMPA